MAKTRQTSVLKWLAIAAGAIWILGTGWLQITSFGSPSHVPTSPHLSSVAEKCREGYSNRTFSERYECTSRLTLSYNRMIFAEGLKRVMIVFAPPLLLLALYRFVMSRSEKKKKKTASTRRKSTNRPKVLHARDNEREHELSEERGKELAASERVRELLDEGRRQYSEAKQRIESNDDEGWYIDSDENMCKVITESVTSEDGSTETISALIRLNSEGNKQIIRL